MRSPCSPKYSHHPEKKPIPECQEVDILRIGKIPFFKQLDPGTPGFNLPGIVNSPTDSRSGLLNGWMIAGTYSRQTAIGIKRNLASGQTLLQISQQLLDLHFAQVHQQTLGYNTRRAMPLHLVYP